MQLSSQRKQYVQSLHYVTCQRVIRRLCDECKHPVTAPPKLVQQLGGDPRQETTLYQAYRLPPVEQRIDENGLPIEMSPCPVCHGVGYLGRIGVFETIAIDDKIRETLMKTPNLEALSRVCVMQGNPTLSQQGYRFVLAGLASLEEIKRVFQKQS